MPRSYWVYIAVFAVVYMGGCILSGLMGWSTWGVVASAVAAVAAGVSVGKATAR